MSKQKLIIKILVCLTIGNAVFIGLATDDNFLKIVTAIIAATLTYFIDAIIDFFEKQVSKKRKLDFIKKNLSEAKIFFDKYTSIKISVAPLVLKIGKAEVNYNDKHELYDWVLKNVATEINTETKNALLVVALCYEMDNTSDVIVKANYKEVISTVIEQYNLLELDDEAKLVLRYYNNYFSNRKLEEPIANLDYNNELKTFTKKYNGVINIALSFKLEKEQIEEFRRTLAILLSQGKLNVKLLDENLKKKIDSALKKKTNQTKAFLFLANKFHKIPEIETVLKKYPSITFSYKYPNKLPESIKYLHTRIIYPPQNYLSAEDFLTDEIIPLIPEKEKSNGFISIIPIEGTEIYSFPESADEIKSASMKSGFESISAIKTGRALNLADLYVESMHEEIQIENLLSIIPFNIFVPGLPKNIKSFLIENYENLKQHFNIEKLSDWADINISDLATFFVAADVARTDEVTGLPKKRKRNDEGWSKVAKEIISQAIIHKNAMLQT